MLSSPLFLWIFSPPGREAVQNGTAAAVRAQLTIRDIRRELSYLLQRVCMLLHHNTQKPADYIIRGKLPRFML